MGFFRMFEKSSGSTVTAHVLDPVSGYATQTWSVGQDVKQELVERFAEGGNLFVVVIYEAGKPKRVICTREVWDKTKAQFAQIDSTSKSSVTKAIDELPKRR